MTDADMAELERLRAKAAADLAAAERAAEALAQAQMAAR